MKKIIYLFLFWQLSYVLLAQNFAENSFFMQKKIEKTALGTSNDLKQIISTDFLACSIAYWKKHIVIGSCTGELYLLKY